uniref:Uncharacterized protein n=1 Tax=Timema monikensis TaxID=170555 RepID=A0A7R9HT95_9NEOP|nr:unnamed protein product [Timema monikensis]
MSAAGTASWKIPHATIACADDRLNWYTRARLIEKEERLEEEDQKVLKKTPFRRKLSLDEKLAYRPKDLQFTTTTTRQALCNHCRENTHRAKMFSTHEVIHMSKCSKEGHRRAKGPDTDSVSVGPCSWSIRNSTRDYSLRNHVTVSTNEICGLHGEQYIMFSNSQKNMLCVNCFRDTPAEARLHCVDIDTAHTQCTRKLEKAIVLAKHRADSIASVRENITKLPANQQEVLEAVEAEGLFSVCDLQNSVREGLLMFKNLLEELHHNMDTEKHTINSFCQGMQEAIAKTHSNMIMEVQRQFETKERQFRSQLMSLSTVLPLLQLHILLCSSFSSSANKYQFLDLAYPMMDRLAAVSQLSHPLRPVQSSQIRTNYRNEFSHSLEPWVGKSSTSSQQQPAQSILADIGPSSGGTYDSTQHQSSNQQSTSGHVHAPPSKRQHTALRAKALEGEGPFSNHCRSFDSQIKAISQMMDGKIWRYHVDNNRQQCECSRQIS